MNIVVKPLTELHHAACNARLHPEKQIAELKRSLERNGQTRLLVIDEEGTIWIGNGLYQAMCEMGMESAHCIVVEDRSEADKKKMMLSDNQIFTLGATDMDALDALIRELSEDLDIPGYDEDFLKTIAADLEEIDSLIEELETEASEDKPQADLEQKAEEPEVPELPRVPRSHPGDIYQLGRHRVMCGDSTKLTDVLQLMDGAHAQLLLTDPPYNVDYEGEAGKIANDSMSDRAFRQFLHKALSAADHVMNPGAAFYVWHADSNGLTFRQACQRVGWEVRQCLIWVKNTFVLGRQDYQWKHEPCLYGWKDGATHIWNGDRKQTTVFQVDKPQRSALHPTMKPVELFTSQMVNSSRPGDIVLDLFGGSGTTLIAAEQSDRTAYIMEYDPKFVDVIVDRWELLTGGTAVLVGTAPGPKVA